ncbi:MAG: type II toxin-antitoxin system VapC family toxin [Candidatus Acidiferrum sp.]
MNRFVLDASVALSWFVDKPVVPDAEHARQLLTKGWAARVPAIWQLEMLNGFVKAERRRSLSGKEVDESFVEMQRLLATSVRLDAGLASLEDTLMLSRSLQVTSYDASYIELASREGLPLATLDKGLRAAAVKAGVALLK